MAQNMKPDNDKSLRDHLLSLLSEVNAHISFDDFIKDFPAGLCGKKIEGLPYTAWQVLEHMRIAQWDILEFSRDAQHVSPPWPKGYWPEQDQVGLLPTTTRTIWARSSSSAESCKRNHRVARSRTLSFPS